MAERDSKGRFVKGTQIKSKGRPKGTVGKSLRRLLRETAEAEKQAIITAMLALAKGGDVRAAEWVAKWSDDPSAANLEMATRDFTIRIGVPERAPDDDA